MELPSLRNYIILDNSQLTRTDDYLFLVETKYPPTKCQYCRSTNIVFNGRYTTQVRDKNYVDDKGIGLLIKARKYICRNCLCVSMEDLPDVSEEHRMTTALVNYIGEESLHHSFAHVADMLGMDESTIKEVFVGYARKKLSKKIIITPGILGIDEIYDKRTHKYYAVIVDLASRIVLKILKGREQYLIEDYLLNLPNRRNIKCVAIDMWDGYRKAVETVLPHAEIIIDKFHIEKEANKLLNGERQKRQNQKSKNIKHSRRVLLKRHKDLSNSQLAKLNKIQSISPQLIKAYIAKEEFYDIWDNSLSREEAMIKYNLWVQRVEQMGLTPVFQKLQNTVQNWWKYIFNFCTYTITNAFTEQRNSYIRSIIRQGRGYSLEVLQYKVLLGQFKGCRPKFDFRVKE